MALWTAPIYSWTPTAVADATNMTDNGHQTIQGGSATQYIELVEVFIGGQASVHSPTFLLLTHNSIVGATLTALRFAAAHPSTANLAAMPTHYAVSTTKPQRSATLTLLNLSMNALGGIVRWHRGWDQRFALLGNTASLGELSLNCATGGTPGLIGTHLVVETF